MVMLKHEVNEAQKEAFAVLAMRDAVALISKEKQISYEDALLLFIKSNIYGVLFDFETGVWKESPYYIFDLYNRYTK